MKHLLRVLFILALFCGVSSIARADAVDFSTQILDPVCSITSPIECNVVDPSVSFPVTFDSETCTLHFGAGNPNTGANFGCFIVNNESTVTFTSLNLMLSDGSATFGCLTSPGSIFSNSSCSPSGNLSFFGPPGLPSTKTMAVVIELTEQGMADGFKVGDVTGTAIVNTPEPDSLILFSTGAMMMTVGLFMRKQYRFAFRKK
jgi:hypothetical protein